MASTLMARSASPAASKGRLHIEPESRQPLLWAELFDCGLEIGRAPGGSVPVVAVGGPLPSATVALPMFHDYTPRWV